MQKYLKTGMVLGLVLVAATVVWLSRLPALSTKARMLNSYNTAASEETAGSSNNSSTTKLTTETEDLTHRQDTEKAENNQLSTIRNRSKLRFHIVHKGETLSDISNKYYGSANRWREILDANRKVIKDANKLTPGTKLIIPD